mmetsp:Transcript_5415/g.6341  ORF Transcript_5415/g.6341 Transcript_5415/m.6341 type:complete len:195 (+) Transcript_5415:23-607(+)
MNTSSPAQTEETSEKVASKLEESHDEAKKPYNVFRDTPLRYMGYANEIGESFRYQFPKLVVPTYVLAFGYCGLDSISSGYREWNDEKESSKDGASTRESRAVVAAFDTLLWQSLASVMIPGGTINIIVRASRFAMARSTVFSAPVKKWLPTYAGIGSIPFIVQPIDSFVDYALDNTIRVWINGEKGKSEEVPKT